MSTVIDERIVEMRFDNAQFEAGVKESMQTLSKLKTALDKSDSAKAFDGLDRAVKNVQLDGIAAGVEALQKRFSVLGLVGMKAINGIADTLYGMTRKLYSATIGQIWSGGIKRAMNMENARFQLQALFSKEENAAELVEQVMKDANAAVEGTRYSLDAAAMAASQFAATGIKAGDEMKDALRGIVGVASMTNSEFEGISNIFTTVAGQGRVMGDQLNQLASRGLNASATIATFVNGVIDGSIKASDEVTALAKSFSKGVKLTEGDIRDLVSRGQISFKLFSEAMTDAFADSAEKANETFTGALSNVKSALSRIGAGFISPLIAQNSKIVELFNALRLKINEFKKAIVFDEEVGNIYAVSKIFTDWVLKMAAVLTEFINKIDTESVMRDFYYGLKITMNVFKALWIVVKPALMAMSGLLNPIGEAIYTILVALEAVTSRMIASEGTLTSLGEVLKSIVDIIGTLVGWVLKLIQKVFKPLNVETKATSNGFKELLDIIADALKRFNNWLQTSPLIVKAFDGLAAVISKVVSVIGTLGKLLTSGIGFGFSSMVKAFGGFTANIKAAKNVPSIIDGIKQSLSGLSKSSIKIDLPQVLKDYIEQARLYSERVGNGLPKIAQNVIFAVKTVMLVLGGFGKSIIDVYKNITKFYECVASILKGIITFENIKKVFIGIVDAAKRFITFMVDLANALTGVFVGGGIMYLANKFMNSMAIAVKGIDKVLTGFGKVLTSTSGLLDQTKKTLKAYQHDINASALIKIAGAIAILSGSLILLSFADPERVMYSAAALGVVGGVLIAALSVLQKAVGRAKNVYDVMDTLAKQIGSAVRWKAIGSALKSVGESILMIAGSLIAIALMYRYDSESMNEAVKLIAAIGLCIVGLMTTMSLLGKVIGTGMKSFAMAAAGVAAISGSILMVVISLEKLFKMDLPMDYKQKLNILYNIIGTLTAITAIFTLISSISHGGKGNTIPIFHLFLSLHAIISAMQRLFKITLPVDYKKKLGILDRIIVEIAALMVAMGVATRIAGGAIKAGGTILALSAFMITLVGSLSILTLLPIDKIYKEILALGGIMLAMGGAIALAGAFAKSDTSKAIFAMGILIGAITASLSALTLFDSKDLLIGAVALSSIILSVGKALENASKIDKAMSIAGIVAMLAGVAEIAYALYKISTRPWKEMIASGAAMYLVMKAYSDAFGAIADGAANLKFKMVGEFLLATLSVFPLALALYSISEQPWDGMLASGVAMGITLKAYAKSFEILGNTSAIDIKQIWKFILAAAVSIPLGISLGILAHQPWDGMLASGVAMSATLIAFSKAFNVLSKTNSVDKKQVGNFLLASLSVFSIGAALVILAHQPWDGMLGAALSLSATLLVFSACFAIVAKTVTPDLKLAGEFVAASLALIPIAIALKMISGQPWQELLGASAALSLVLVSLAATMDICIVAGKFSKEAAQGIGLLLLFIAGLVATVGIIGSLVNVIDKYLGGSATRAITRGIEIIQQVSEGLGSAIGSFIYGIGEGLTNKLYIIADNLSLFMEHLKPFTDGLEYITEDSIKGVMMLGEMVVSLTKAELQQGFAALLGGKIDFAALGEQLNRMAPYLKTFSDSVAGIAPSSVEGAKTVSEIMLALSTSLPRVGGVIDEIFGHKKTLTDFAKELDDFGPSIASFAEKVKDVDPASVEGAASAAKIMAAAAEELPPADGLVQKIFGQKTLAEFAVELDAFGPAIVAFAETVKDVKASSVEGAANAGGMMARLAEELPNSGGLLGEFFGDNDISDFGNSLVSYGESIVDFVEKVNELKPSDINGVATITEIMSELATALPNTESVFAVFTGGKMDFKKFGEQLEKFGKSLAKYSDSTSGINFGHVEIATDVITKLIDMLTMAENVDSDAMTNFALALSSIPGIAIQEFVTGIQNGDVLVRDAIDALFANLNVEINTAYGPLLETSKSLVNSLATALTLYLSTPFGKTKAKMVEIGEYVAKGLETGLNNKTEDLRIAAQNMAKVVEDATREQLQINSPSRLAMEIGGWWPKSLAAGMASEQNTLKMTTMKMAQMVEDTTRDILDVHSESPKFFDIGEWVPISSADGLESGLPALAAAFEKMAGEVSKGIDKVKNAAKDSDFFGTVYEAFGDNWFGDIGDKLEKTLDKTIEKTTETATNSMASSYSGSTKSGGGTKAAQEAVLQQEETYWTRLLEIKKTGVDAAKYKDMDIAKFQETVLTETTETWKNYTDQLESTRDSIMSSVNLFAEVEKKDGIKTKEELEKNLNDQIDLYRHHAEMLQTLRARLGDDSELGDYLTSLGVDSYEQLKVINSMTDEELTNYANLYDQKMAYATNIAASQLTDLQKTTEQKLAEIFGGMTDSVNMYDFAAVFDGTFQSVDKFVSDIMIPLQEAKQAMADLGEPIVASLEDSFNGTRIGKIVLAGLDTAWEAIRNSESNGNEIGNELGNNLSDGIGEALTKVKFMDPARKMMKQLVTDLQDEGEIHSPSKLTEREVGQHLTEGIAIGLNNADAQASIMAAVAGLVTYIIETFTGNQETLNECGMTIGQTIRDGMIGGTEGFIDDVASITADTMTELRGTWNEDDLFEIGSNIIGFIQNGVLFVRPTFISDITTLCEDTIDTFIVLLNEEVFGEIGQNVVVFTDQGILSAQNIILMTCYDLCEQIIDTFRTYLAYSVFYDLGRFSMQGFEDGINSKFKDVQNAAGSIADAVAITMRATLDIHSPSGVAFAIGQNVSKGMAYGMLNMANLVSDAGTELSEDAMKPAEMLKKAIDMALQILNDEDFDTNIRITPLVDLSQVKSSVDEITALFNRAMSLTTNNAMSVSESFNNSRNANTGRGSDDLVNGGASGPNYNFIQNNYSPKALSRMEIYRRTKNQFQQFKEATAR